MHMDTSVKRRLWKYQNKLPEQIQLRFLKQLHRFLLKGYPLLEALEVIRWDKELEKTALEFIQLLKAGDPLDIVFEKTGFHHTICSFLYFIRANSNLNESIGKCAEMYEHRVKNVKKFKQILRYPFILLFIFLITIFFINQQILPSFQALLQSSPQAMNTINISVFIIDALQFFIIMMLTVFLLSFLVWQNIKKKIPVEQQLKLISRIPVYRSIIRTQTSFQMAAHFSSLIKAGLSLKEILKELSKQKKLQIIAYYAEMLTKDLNRGFHLSSLLSELSFIERPLAAIFHKNTDMYALEKDLNLYSEMLMEEMQRKTIQAITLIQPLFYILLAIFIIFIYISLMWPMFQLMNTL